jgi:uncharacterized membrane protein YgcG
MTIRARLPRRLAIAVVITSCVLWAAPPPASAFNPVKPICTIAGLVSGLAGKVCTVAGHAGRLVSAGKKLAGGHVGGAVKTVLGDAGGGARTAATTALGLAALGAWVLGGAKFGLHETAKVLAATSRPELQSTWFSAAYWRMAAVAALLTLPFLFAAAVQAMMRSDLTLLARAVLGYLPLALLAVSVAAPLTTLLLAASDEMAAIVSSAAGNAGAHFLDQASLTIGGLTLLSGSPFLAFLVGLFTAAGTLALWLELLMREAAVYVIVLMLPLVFAALVWPARRIWAIRAVELLVALILSKFAIVAVLALGGAALSHSVGHSVTGFMAGIVLVSLGAFAPWALLRLMPLSEMASATAGSLRSESRAVRPPLEVAEGGAQWAHEWNGGMTANMRRQAQETSESAVAHDAPPPGSDGGSSRLALTQAADADHGATNGESDAGQFDGAGPGAGSVDQAATRAGGTRDLGAPASAAGSPGSGSPGTGGGGTGGSGGSGGGGGGGGSGGGAEGGAAGDRLPGMGPMWQAPDEGWRTLDLGPCGAGPRPPLWDPDDHSASGDSEAGTDAHAQPGDTADDHDPLPPGQDPEEGRL